MSLPPLPAMSYNFLDIRSNNTLYADKTGYIYELLRKPKGAYFLSRPRRFGKSLLLSTLNCLFSGDRRLFEGLDIARADYAFPRIPVIRMSLIMDRTDPPGLRGQLEEKLESIAADLGLDVQPAAPGAYFGEIIKALSRASKSRIAVLIDEYDAPVTRRMDELDDLDVARGNAGVLQDFFSILKDDEVSERVRFSLVTGITRYAMATLDSGPNQLHDISLDPKYAGICGFTTGEFDALFADRMETLLKALQKSGQAPPSANVEDLRKLIFTWYDGYNWGGDERILNPCSILCSFRQGMLSDHWVRTGRPGHLPGLIRDDPEACCRPELESLLGDELRRADLDGLRAVPALFHSGYLTLDKAGVAPVLDETTGETFIKDIYSFRYPNFEVRSYFKRYFLKIIFENADASEFDSDYGKLARALSTRDAETVGAIFGKYFAAIPHRRRPARERDFHSHVLALLMGMKFKLCTEMPGAKGRLDLCVELPKGVHVVIELKYCQSSDKLGGAERNRVLAILAIDALTIEEQDQTLAELALEKLDSEKTYAILAEDPAGTRRDELLAPAAMKHLAKDVIDKALATAVEKKLPPEEIDAALNKAAPDAYLTEEQIENKLSEAAQTALKAITEKNYHGIVAYKAKEIIDLGLSTFGHEPKVKALFAPKQPSS